jgi:hypothetical protein
MTPLDNALKPYQLAPMSTSATDMLLLERRIAHTKQLLAKLAPKQSKPRKN